MAVMRLKMMFITHTGSSLLLILSALSKLLPPPIGLVESILVAGCTRCRAYKLAFCLLSVFLNQVSSKFLEHSPSPSSCRLPVLSRAGRRADPVYLVQKLSIDGSTLTSSLLQCQLLVSTSVPNDTTLVAAQS